MVNPFVIIWRGIADVYNELFPMVGMNLLWLIISIPIVGVITLVLAIFRLPGEVAFPLALLFAILGPNPAAVGIHTYVNQLAKDERVEFELFWSGLKQLGPRGVLLLAVAVVVTLLLAVNLVFYLNSSVRILQYLAILWLYVMLLWFMMMLYMNPLLVEQQTKSIRLIIRNAFVLALDNIVPSIILLIVLVVVSAVSIAITLLIALVSGALVADVQTRAVLAYLEKYERRAAKQAP
ncbi:MAG: hypothetical protein IRY83_05285 [Chloroflexi bacterium]|nr:hypothetical protein [Chloroflexota bacterium]